MLYMRLADTLCCCLAEQNKEIKPKTKAVMQEEAL